MSSAYLNIYIKYYGLPRIASNFLRLVSVGGVKNKKKYQNYIRFSKDRDKMLNSIHLSYSRKKSGVGMEFHYSYNSDSGFAKDTCEVCSQRCSNSMHLKLTSTVTIFVTFR